MLADRGPQITLEFVNGYNLTPGQAESLHIFDPGIKQESYDLRIPVLKRAEALIKEAQLPVEVKLAGVFALDMPISGVSKKLAVRFVLESDEVLRTIGLSKAQIQDPNTLEIWGDKYSEVRGGTDRYWKPPLS